MRWALLGFGGLVFLFYMLVDVAFLLSRVSVWPGTWIYAVFAATELGILILAGYFTMARHSSRRTILRNLTVVVWCMNLVSLAIGLGGFYGFM